MIEKLFIDTWGWIVILNKREPLHQEVNRLYKKVRLERAKELRLKFRDKPEISFTDLTS